MVAINKYFALTQTVHTRGKLEANGGHFGAGNKLDPTKFRITDISKTFGCPLARVMRKELRARGVDHLQVVFSPEEAAPTEQLETPPPGRRSIPASVPWVPSCAGLMMGGAIVRALAESKEVD